MCNVNFLENLLQTGICFFKIIEFILNVKNVKIIFFRIFGGHGLKTKNKKMQVLNRHALITYNNCVKKIRHSF